jgi:hypothetical protein
LALAVPPFFLKAKVTPELPALTKATDKADKLALAKARAAKRAEYTVE